MTTKELEKLINGSANIAKLFAPQFTGYIVIGQIIANLAPELYETVVKMATGIKPTKEELNDLNFKIRELGFPENIR